MFLLCHNEARDSNEYEKFMQYLNLVTTRGACAILRGRYTVYFKQTLHKLRKLTKPKPRIGSADEKRVWNSEEIYPPHDVTSSIIIITIRTGLGMLWRQVMDFMRRVATHYLLRF